MKVYMSNIRPTRVLSNLFIRIYMEYLAAVIRKIIIMATFNKKSILDTIIRSMLYTDNLISSYLITDGK